MGQVRNDKHSSLEESDLHLNAMSLRRGKVLLEEPAIKRRAPTIPLSHETAPASPESVFSSSSVPTTPASSDDEPEWPEAMPDAVPEAADRQVTGSENFLTEFSTDFHQTIVDGYKDDSQFSKALVAGVESGIYVLRNGLLYLATPGTHRLCIPDTKVEGGRGKGKRNLCEMLMAHAHEIAGHLGPEKTDKLLREQFYWKTMTGDVQKYCNSCHSCQTKKAFPSKRFGKNHPLPIPSAPWQQVSMDFMPGLPSSAVGNQKFNNLLVVVDTLIKQVHLIPTTKDVTAEGVAQLYFDNIYKLHGLPRAIISDRDTKCTGVFWRTLQKMVGTDLMMSTADHPQTDRQTERMNRTILQILRQFVNTNGSDWAQYLATVEFAINSSINRSTGKAPFELLYGYLPRTFPPIVFDLDNPTSMDFIKNRMLSQLIAQDAIIAAKTEQSHHVNKHRKPDPDIAVGDMVLVSNESQLQHLPKGRQKLAIKLVGPYKVTKVDKSKSNYTLDIPDSRRHNTFYVSYLQKYQDPHLERGGWRDLRVTLPVSPKLLQLADSDSGNLIFGSRYL